MLALGKVVVTGGLSSGKTTVCQLLKHLGAYVISADTIVHQLLLSPYSAVGQQIIQLLGADIITNKQLNHHMIAERAFADPQKLERLEALLHPLVFAEIEKEYASACHTPGIALFIAEIPLFFESPWKASYHYDAVVCVSAPKELCKARFLNNPLHTAADFEQRLHHQLPPDEKARQADYLINNNGSLSHLEKQAGELYKQLISPPTLN